MAKESRKQLISRWIREIKDANVFLGSRLIEPIKKDEIDAHNKRYSTELKEYFVIVGEMNEKERSHYEIGFGENENGEQRLEVIHVPDTPYGGRDIAYGSPASDENSKIITQVLNYRLSRITEENKNSLPHYQLSNITGVRQEVRSV